MWQDIAVAGAVVGAGAYAAWYLLPAAWRVRLFRWRPALAKAPGCSSCSDCGGCGPKVGAASGAVPVSDPASRPDGSHPIKFVGRL